MTFSRALHHATLLLFLCGYLALLTSGGLGLGLSYLAVLLVAWKGFSLRLEGRWQLLWVLCLLAFSLVDAYLLSGLKAAAAHLLIGLGLIKILTPKRERDRVLLSFISFSLILLAATTAVSVLFLALLVAYVFLAVLTLILLECGKGQDKRDPAPFTVSGCVPVAAATTVALIVVAVPIFLVIPRSGPLFIWLSQDSSGTLSGFSEQVQLGDLGRIIPNHRVVMRVQVDLPSEALPSDLKLRGITLDHYDGKSWSNTRTSYRRLAASHPPMGFLVANQRRQDESLVRQSVVLESFTNLIFGLPRMISVAGSGFFDGPIFQDGNGAVRFFPSGRRAVRYVADSDLLGRDQQLQLRTGQDGRSDVGRHYLQLPDLASSVYEMAREFRLRHTDPAKQAMLIEHFLKTQYEYSLQNRSSLAQDPLHQFLLVDKAGHCEYFATAQAVLMRILGIPARVINGFRLGEFNAWSGSYIVRQSDAHSWVEGYFPGAGWVEFDPTPGGHRNAPYLRQLAARFLDALDLFWLEVISFDRFRQMGLLYSAHTQLRFAAIGAWNFLSRRSATALNWWPAPGRYTENLLSPVGALVFLVFSLSGLVWLLARKHSFLGRFANIPAEPVLPEYYSQMLEIVRSKGFSKRPAETGAEFAKRVEGPLGTTLPVRITRHYYRERFGKQPLDSDARTAIRLSLRRWAKWSLRNSPPRAEEVCRGEPGRRGPGAE